MTNRVELLAQLLSSCEKVEDPVTNAIWWNLDAELIADYSAVTQTIQVSEVAHEMLGMESYTLAGRTVRYLLENG